MIFLARSMRFALRRLLLCVELAKGTTLSGGISRGMYPSAAMLGSVFCHGSRMKLTLTMSLCGVSFYTYELALDDGGRTMDG
jgi:hypothetical protein